MTRTSGLIGGWTDNVAEHRGGGSAQCVEFLRWALPHLRLRWSGFRKVRRQVWRRVRRRAAALGLGDLFAYRAYLERHREEWAALDVLTHITISSFYRDRAVFDFLQREVLPSLAMRALMGGRTSFEVWSAACASGEEPYTLSIMWRLALRTRYPNPPLHVLATDVEPAALVRAREACYAPGSVRQLPDSWRSLAFDERAGQLCLRPSLRRCVEIAQHDVRTAVIGGPYDLVLCRNPVFTYFEESLQREVLARFAGGNATWGCAGARPPRVHTGGRAHSQSVAVSPDVYRRE
jgi:chemotaxis protein methyltransferase CheR